MSLTKKKILRSDNIEKKITLIINDDKVEFELISSKLDKANELFLEYKENNKIPDFKKLEILENIIELVEINPKYNFEFLKLQKKLKIKENYDYDFKQLSPTLSENDYYNLTKKSQENPSKRIFNLIKTFCENEKYFDEQAKKINYIPYNIPLIEGNERLRNNYYFQLFSHYENALNDNQKKYLLNPNIDIEPNEKEKIKILKNKYDALKKGIKRIKSLIPDMEIFFNDIKLEDNNLNIKMLTFMLYISDIFTRIPYSGNKPMFITNFFQKEIDPTNELNGKISTENILITKKNSNFPGNYGIKKIEEKGKIYTYEIFNEFESISFDGRNYILDNLIEDYQENCFIPLDILLLRNQSLDYFQKNNQNFLNLSDEIYNQFKIYFKTIIKSNCVLEALKTNDEYKNIIELIKNDSIINKFLEKKYLKSIPLFDFSGSGYTNKDILVSCVTGFPFIIYNFDAPETFEEYKELRNIIILFNIGMKLITLIHEFIIHLCYGYLNYLSDGKILSTSPKREKKNIAKDGGLFFEQKLFGKQYGNITIKEILVLLNGGDSFNSIENLQINLANDINLEEFKANSDFLKLILENYNITFKRLIDSNIYSFMKSEGNEIYIKRDLMNIILPHKTELPYNYVKRSHKK